MDRLRKVKMGSEGCRPSAPRGPVRVSPLWHHRHLGLDNLCCGAALCIVGRWAASLASTH